jgi:hypothetical protein
MNIFAISDLHLGFYQNRNMDKFGDNWQSHTDKIKTAWERVVANDDTVLIPGDVSWAIHLREVMPDLEFINRLSGRKIISEGNHDSFWWKSQKKMEGLFDSITFLKRSHTLCEGYVVCGTRGWDMPGNPLRGGEDYTAHDLKIYKRELNRLQSVLANAVKAHGDKKIIVMMHFPPIIVNIPSEYVEILRQYPVETVVYGHLHGDAFDYGFKGIRDGINYSLVSADYVNFCPIQIFKEG